MAIRSMVNPNGMHRTKADKARRDYEESLINSDGIDLDNMPDTVFVNGTAHSEYNRVLRRLREEAGVVGNLNKSDLLAYSNSYGKYIDYVQICRADDFEYVIETNRGPAPNPVLRLMDEAQRCMGEAARRLGMTVDGQLKTAKAKADKEEAEMESIFGAI